MKNTCDSEARPSLAARHQRQHYIVILPFLAPGHMIPTIPLAARLASFPATTVTLASTPLNAAHLADSLPPASSVRVSALPFHPPEHGLPDGAENLDSIPDELYPRLFCAVSSLRPHFRNLLSDIQLRAPEDSRLTVVSDAVFYWTVEVAREFGARHAFLHTSGGYGVAAYKATLSHLPLLRMKGTPEDDEFRLPGFPERFRFRIDQLPEKLRRTNGDHWKEFASKRTATVTSPTDGLLINTVEELECEGLRLFREMNKGIPVFPIGPLHLLAETSSAKEKRAWKKTGTRAAACTAWLDNHPRESVLYISFGSQYNINGAQMMALAAGLEASGVPFLWVVRAPVEFTLEKEFRDEWLPVRFEARVNATKQGMLVRSWAPQPEILSHPSVGAFLSHCGWNSILEVLSCGVPVVGWPLAADQYFNAQMLAEELGVCVVVARGEKQDVSAEHVERVVKEMMFGEKGREMRRKAAEAAEIIRAATMEEQEGDGEWKNGSSVQALYDFFFSQNM